MNDNDFVTYNKDGSLNYRDDMTEPLTDEEFEEMKEWRHSPYQNGEIAVPPPTMKKIDHLIATVEREMQKVFHLGGGLENWKKQYFEAKEENAKLKAEKETSIYDYADLRKELDVALKRIEEME